MTRKLRHIVLLFGIFIVLFISSVPCFGTEIKRGVAHGTFHLQGYSGDGAAGTLTFYNLGSMAEESSISYVDDAYISTDEKGYWDYVSLKGTFSGGPNGVATFTTAEGFTFNVQLKDGRVFEVNQPGVWITMTVSDPSIFYSDDYAPEEYDPNAPLEDSGIKINHRDGQLEIACPPDLDAWDVLKEGRTIYTHCHIKTGEDSTVQLDFPDMTTFKMRPETEIVIDALPKQSKIGLLFGGIWANVKKMAKDGTMEVHGSQAVAGIKGTTFIMEETGGRSTLKVVEGTVSYSSKTTDKSIDITAGESVIATQKGLGEKSQFDVESEGKEWESESDSDANILMYSMILVGIAAAIIAFFIFKKKHNKL
jgi:hypothetical protein